MSRNRKMCLNSIRKVQELWGWIFLVSYCLNGRTAELKVFFCYFCSSTFNPKEIKHKYSQETLILKGNIFFRDYEINELYVSCGNMICAHSA